MTIVQKMSDSNKRLQTEVVKTAGFEITHLDHIKKVVKYIEGSILDIGCGQGMALEYLRNIGYEDLMGIDLSYEAVIMARHKGLVAEVMDIHDRPFLHRTFDTIILSHTLEHILDLPDAAEHLYNICAKYLIIIVPKETPQQMNRNELHVNCFTSFADVLEFFPGFEVVEKAEENGDLRLVFKRKQNAQTS